MHIDRLPSIIQNKGLFSDAIIRNGNYPGSTIGMSSIKDRRLTECELNSHPGLYVGECVPFYFCPRPVMLYLMHVRNLELSYKGGQESIIHLVSDLRETIAYAEYNKLRWAFTSSNAGSKYFEDFANLNQLSELNWDAINATYWKDCREAKQAEFLVENSFHWDLIESIGVYNQSMYDDVLNMLAPLQQYPKIEIKRNWYY